MSVTSQINPEEAKEMLEPYVKEGKDVLHLAFSSALSGTCNSMKIAAEELQEEYPEAKVIVVDTLCACMGEAMLLYYALKQKEAGKTIEEVAQWVEENKLHVCHNVTVDDLNHLHRGGRVSRTSGSAGNPGPESNRSYIWMIEGATAGHRERARAKEIAAQDRRHGQWSVPNAMGQ